LKEQQSDLRYALYDPDSQTWSDEITLTNDAQFEASPVFALDGSGKLLTAYLSEHTDSEQHDLRWLEHELGRDLTVSSIQIDPIEDSPSNYAIVANIRNLGALPSGDATLSFYLGDPDSGGTLLSEQVVNLKGGEQSQVTIQATGDLSDQIYVRIDSAGTVDELDETNNTATSALNPADLAASYLTWDRSVSDETTLTLSGTVTNNGSTTQINIPVEITNDSGVIHSETLTTLAAGESTDITTTLTNLTGTEHRFTLSVDPSQTLDEPDQSDNERTLLLSLRHLKDSDGDGMENAWEELHFGTLERDGRGDFDADGLTDTFEFLTQNNPNDPKSKFPFTIEPHPTDLDKVIIRFPSALGRVYRIQRASDFINWTNDSYHLGTDDILSVSTSSESDTQNLESRLSGFRVSISLE
jgi:hypothetical protein